MIVIGSTALLMNGSYQHVPNDLDIVCHSDEFKIAVKCIQETQGKILKLDFKPSGAVAVFESKIILEASFHDKSELDKQLFDFLKDNPEYFKDIPKQDLGLDYFLPGVYVVPEVVLMMKLSHRYKKDSEHFEKTMQSICNLRKQGYKLDSKLEQQLKQREELTYKLWKQKPYKLNVKSNEFFTDNVQYKYDHDSLHQAVKHLWQPAYTYYMQDQAEVMCSKEKFFELPEHIRLLGVLEEVYVLALERSIIAFDTPPYVACKKALEKVCTSITSGWFREYAYDNYHKVLSMVDGTTLMQMYKQGLENGTIKPYTKTMA